MRVGPLTVYKIYDAKNIYPSNTFFIIVEILDEFSVALAAHWKI